MDKYLALARDASSSGDRVLAENYFQHADHYYRVIGNTGTATSSRIGQRQPLSQATPAVPTPDTDETDDLEQAGEDKQPAGENKQANGETATAAATAAESAEVVGF
ncbi:hypothetical protein RIEGSTA812A_PEG_436 [invertebrate metagenome]|uniref:DUF4167 domain-containing protein n=1 Tax=invertebrate metagenome TaxID=1711999 RepID=A0A484H8B3_9ZZZZ